MSFPKDFVWGSAASSYQIEGAWDAEGKGLSVWDMLTRQPGKVWEGHTGDVACDHYHRYVEDVALMKEVGLHAYRLSISWPRVLPQGTGAINKAGLGFYDRLIDELLAKGIQPWVTLFHWDYPYDLFVRGGWLNPESPKWFADYTATIVDCLSDRVEHWMTLNETQCFIGLGHQLDNGGPGLKLGLSEVLLAAHHAMMAHGLAVQTIRARARKKPVIGWAPVGVAYFPATDTPEDRDAAWRAMGAVHADSVWNNRWWGDPLALGSYPEEGLQAYGKAVPRFKSSDLELMKQPLDFYGCNIYNGQPIKAGPDGKPIAVPFPAGHPHTLFYWRMSPECLFWGAKFLAEHYQLPLVITENGMSNPDWVSLDGKVHDPQRIDFLHRYLLALREVIAGGADIRGYFQWSIMDNFEWCEGYRQRFGLIHVDYETQKRTLKDSAYWYRDVIRTNGENL
jgi:beta-glucosidase